MSPCLLPSFSTVLAVSVLATSPLAVAQGLSWAAQPAAPAGHGVHQHGAAESQAQPAPPAAGHRRGKTFVLNGDLSAEVKVQLYRPDFDTTVQTLQGSQLKLKPSGVGNYHALVAHQQGEGFEHTAVRYVYLNGKPSGHSPSELLAQPLSRLEIVPAPLPREHRVYTTAKPARFEIRFDGYPVPQQPITLTTAAGTQLDLLTDDQGVLLLNFPKDFSEVIPGRRQTPPGDWQLSSYIRDDGVVYRTSLSGAYSPDPGHWLSYGLGALVACIGFGAGMVVNRRLPVQPRRAKK
ncbi:MAG: hypothetical protein OIF57_18485 [Marinobacterium sp.]|nr:hypothetical protein [Marinobacterium sp.]